MIQFHEIRQPFSLLWANDVHFDSPFCQREKFLKDCKKADKIILSGDFWDCMEGFGDKRFHKKDDDVKGYYINDLVELACNNLKPFKDKIVGWNSGNHELAFNKYHDTDLTGLVCKLLGIEPKRLGMRGYHIIQFWDKTEVRQSIKIYYQHNSGSNGKRSKGALAADLLAGEHPSADIWIAEHSHKGVIVPVKSCKINNQYNISFVSKYFINGLTYKAADEDQEGMTFEINKAQGLTPIGGIFIDFIREYTDGKNPYYSAEPRFSLK